MRHGNRDQKHKIFWSQADLIDTITCYSGIEQETVEKVFTWLEDVLINHLKYDFDSCGDNVITEVHIFKGLSITSEKIGEKDYIIDGKTVTATPRIKARAHLSRCFVRKTLNGLANG